MPSGKREMQFISSKWPIKLSSFISNALLAGEWALIITYPPTQWSFGTTQTLQWRTSFTLDGFSMVSVKLHLYLTALDGLNMVSVMLHNLYWILLEFSDLGNQLEKDLPNKYCSINKGKDVHFKILHMIDPTNAKIATDITVKWSFCEDMTKHNCIRSWNVIR